MIVRWGLDQLPRVLDEVGSSRPLLVASPRWADQELPIRPAASWSEVPSDRIAEAAAKAGEGVVLTFAVPL